MEYVIITHDKHHVQLRHPFGEAIYNRWKTTLHARTFSGVAPANMASENPSSNFGQKTVSEREATETADGSSPPYTPSSAR